MRIHRVPGLWWRAAGVALCLTGGAGAEEPGVWADATVNTQVVRLGEPFHLDVTAGARFGWIYLPGASLVLPGYAMLGYTEKDVSSRHEGFNARQGRYRLAAFELGQPIIPSIPIQYQNAAGTTGTARTRPVEIQVASMNPAPGAALRDPRPPQRPGPPWMLWAGVVGLGVLAWGYGRSRQGRFRTVAVPAHQTAQSELDRLGQSRCVAEGNAQDYFIELSRIMRRFLAERYQFSASEMPRTAILEELERRQVDSTDLVLIRQLLAEADWIKFAQGEADINRIYQAQQRAREVVERNREPRPNETGGAI